jgi:hypothetical protein
LDRIDACRDELCRRDQRGATGCGTLGNATPIRVAGSAAEESAGEQGPHVTATINDQADDDLSVDEAVDHSVGFELGPTVLLDPVCRHLPWKAIAPGQVLWISYERQQSVEHAGDSNRTVKIGDERVSSHQQRCKGSAGHTFDRLLGPKVALWYCNALQPKE